MKLKKLLFASLAFLSFSTNAADNFNISDNTAITISGGTIDNTIIGGTTPAAARVTTLRVGNANDLYLTRYAAKQLMISGDGVGAAAETGWILGYFGSSGFATLNPSSSPTNPAIYSNGASTTLNGSTEARISSGGTVRLTQSSTAGAGPSITAGTATTDVAALSITRTNNNAAVVKGVEIIYTDTASSAGFLPLSIKGGVAGTTNLFSLGKDGTATFGSSVAIVTSAAFVATAYVNVGAAGLYLTKTITAPATTGAQTINQTTGRVNFAAAATSLVVTNSLATADSICHVTVATNDATMKSAACVTTAGSFTIHANAAATAETAVNFTITN